MIEWFRSLDYFQKVTESVEQKKTLMGGIISVLTITIMIFLIFSEIVLFFSGETNPFPDINYSYNNERIRANINISFYDIPCPGISLDYQDVSGTFYPDLEHSVYKLRLSSNGQLIEDSSKLNKVTRIERPYINPSWPILKYHGILGDHHKDNDCYGASLYHGQLCNTCQDVIDAYATRGWPLPNKGMIKQCVKEGYVKTYDSIPFPGQDIFVTISQGMAQRKLEETNISISKKKINLNKNLIFQSSTIIFTRQNCTESKNMTFRILIDSFEYSNNYYDIGVVELANQECQKEINLNFYNHPEYVEINIFDQSFLLDVSKNNTLCVFEVNYMDEILKFQIDQIEQQYQSTANITTNHDKDNRILSFEQFGQEPNTISFISPEQVIDLVQKKDEGCQLYGHIFLKPIPGSFHASVHGKGVEFAGIVPTPSHKIHLLEFTTEYGETTLGKISSSTNDLDGQETFESDFMSIIYYIKLVPSLYSHPIWGEKKFYQFAYEKGAANNEVRGMSSIEFKYEVDSVMMAFKPKYPSFLTLLIELGGIVGGIFALSIFLERIINTVS